MTVNVDARSLGICPDQNSEVEDLATFLNFQEIIGLASDTVDSNEIGLCPFYSDV